MSPDHLLMLLDAWQQPERDGIARESAQSRGSTYLRERLQVVAERCCRDYPGDLCEIGCLNGSTTVRLAAVARLHGRRVLAVDPWQIGTQNCDGGEYERFLQTTASFKDWIDVLRLDSRGAEAVAAMKARPLAFCFVDGLHQYQACLSDIRACYHSPVICVDDWTWNGDVERALIEGAGPRPRVTLPPLHEAYIL